MEENGRQGTEGKKGEATDPSSWCWIDRKTALRLTLGRINLIRNKRERNLVELRKDVALLLQNGREDSARIRVEYVIREHMMLRAFEVLELFCDLLVIRMPMIEKSKKEPPVDLEEAVASVVFASGRASDLVELATVKRVVQSKYGKEFVARCSAYETALESKVNRRLFDSLDSKPPEPILKLKMLEQIAQEHQVEWDPEQSADLVLTQNKDKIDDITSSEVDEVLRCEGVLDGQGYARKYDSPEEAAQAAAYAATRAEEAARAASSFLEGKHTGAFNDEDAVVLPDINQRGIDNEEAHFQTSGEEPSEPEPTSMAESELDELTKRLEALKNRR